MKLCDITKDNYFDVVMLTTNEDHNPTVMERNLASNAFSLVEASFEERPIYTKAIVHDRGDTVIGFCMYGKNEILGKEVYSLLRFMIDVSFQCKGYGTEALGLILEEMKKLDGCKEIYLKLTPGNTRARHVYHKYGFRSTGDVIDGERLYRLSLE